MSPKTTAAAPKFNNPPRFTQPFARNKQPTAEPARGTPQPGNLEEVKNSISSALAASVARPATKQELEKPETLWTRANLMNHIKYAADVRVQVNGLGGVEYIKIQKSHLLSQLRELPAETMFPAPIGVYDGVGLVLILK